MRNLDGSTPLDQDAGVTEIPHSYPWKHDCGEWVPSTRDGIEVDGEALCHDCAVKLGLAWLLEQGLCVRPWLRFPSKSFLKCLSPYPGGPAECTCWFFFSVIGLPQLRSGSASREHLANTTFHGPLDTTIRSSPEIRTSATARV